MTLALMLTQFLRPQSCHHEKISFHIRKFWNASNRGPKVKDSDLKGAFRPGSVVSESDEDDDDGSEEMKA